MAETPFQKLQRERLEAEKQALIKAGLAKPTQPKKPTVAEKQAEQVKKAVTKTTTVKRGAEYDAKPGELRKRLTATEPELPFKVQTEVPRAVPKELRTGRGEAFKYANVKAADPRLVEAMQNWDAQNPDAPAERRAKIRKALDTFYQAEDERDKAMQSIRNVERAETAFTETAMAVLPGMGAAAAGKYATQLGMKFLPMLATQMGIAGATALGQEELAKKVAPAWAQERARMLQENPDEALVGQLLGSSAAFRANPDRWLKIFSGDKAAIIGTLAEGGLEGGIEAVQQLATNQSLDWKRIGMTALGGMVFTENRFGTPGVPKGRQPKAVPNVSEPGAMYGQRTHKAPSSRTQVIIANAQKVIDAGVPPEKVIPSVLRNVNPKDAPLVQEALMPTPEPEAVAPMVEPAPVTEMQPEMGLPEAGRGEQAQAPEAQAQEVALTPEQSPSSMVRNAHSEDSVEFSPDVEQEFMQGKRDVNGLTAKQREYLAARIQARVQELLDGESTKALAKGGKPDTKITIAVPGDGTFNLDAGTRQLAELHQTLTGRLPEVTMGGKRYLANAGTSKKNPSPVIEFKEQRGNPRSGRSNVIGGANFGPFDPHGEDVMALALADGDIEKAQRILDVKLTKEEWEGAKARYDEYVANTSASNFQQAFNAPARKKEMRKSTRAKINATAQEVVAPVADVSSPEAQAKPISGGLSRSFMLGGQEGARNTGRFTSVDDADLYHYATQRFGRGTGKAGRGKVGAGSTQQAQRERADQIAPMLMERFGVDQQGLDDMARRYYDEVKASAKQAGDGAEFDIPARQPPVEVRPEIPVQETSPVRETQQAILTPIQRAQAVKRENNLNASVTWSMPGQELQSGTRRQYLQSLAQNGYAWDVREVVDEANLKALQATLERLRNASLDRYDPSAIDRVKAEIQNPSTITQYRAVSPDGAWRKLTKTEFEEFQKLSKQFENQPSSTKQVEKPADLPTATWWEHTAADINRVFRDANEYAQAVEQETGKPYQDVRKEMFPNLEQALSERGKSDDILKVAREGNPVPAKVLQFHADELDARADGANLNTGNPSTDASNAQFAERLRKRAQDIRELIQALPEGPTPAPPEPTPAWRAKLKDEANRLRAEIEAEASGGSTSAASGIDPYKIKRAAIILADDIVDGVQVTIDAIRRLLPDATDADVDDVLRQVRDELPSKYANQLPKVEQPVKPTQQTATHRGTEQIREQVGLPEREQQPKTTVKGSLETAEKRGMVANAGAIAKDIANKKRMMTVDEASALNARANQILDQLENTLDVDEADVLRVELDDILGAQEYAGTEWGKFGAIRQRLMKADYSAVGVERKLRKAQITGKQADLIRERAKELRKAEYEIEKRNKKLAELDAAIQAMRELKTEKRSKRATENRNRIKILVDSGMKKLKGLPIKMTGLGANLGNVPFEDFASAVKDFAKAAYLKGANTIEDVLDQLEEPFSDIASRDELLEAMRYVPENVRERRLAEAQARAEKASTKVAGGDFTKRKKWDTVAEAMKSSDPELVKWAKEVQKYRREAAAHQRVIDQQIAKAEAEANYDKLSKFSKAMVQLADLAQVPRTTQAMGDLSGIFNQGYQLALRGGFRAIGKSLADMKKSFTVEGFDQVMGDITRADDFALIQEAKVHLSEPDLASESFLHYGERLIVSRLLGRIPGFSHSKAWSERTFAGYLNRARVEMFRHMYDQATKDLGRELERDELRFLGDYVNVLSGRGDIERIKGLAGLAYAPRFFSSQVQTLVPGTMAVKAAWKAPTLTGTVAADEAKAGLGAMMLYGGAAMAAGLFGWDLVTDPNDTDFGRVKIPMDNQADLIIDLTGGRGAIVRTISQMLSGEKKRQSPATRGKPRDETEFTKTGIPWGEPFMSFVRTKMAPIPGNVVDLKLAGVTPGGIPATYGDLPTQMIPLFAQEAARSYKEAGAFAAGVNAALSFIGIRSSAKPVADTYEQKKAEAQARQDWERKGLESNKLGFLAPKNAKRSSKPKEGGVERTPEQEAYARSLSGSS